MRSLVTTVLVVLLFVPLGVQLANRQAVLAGASQSPQQPATLPSPSPQNQPSPAEPEIDPADVVRVKTTLVNSPVLVIGRDGKFVPTLRREDFQIYEDGIKQDVAYFAPVNKPFTVALVIDTSRSTKFKLPEIQAAASAFVDELRTDDQVLVISFGSEIKVLAEPTSDRVALTRAINSLRMAGGSRVYDALDFTAQRLARIEGRKALILLSDGVDNASTEATIETSLRRLEASDALIYPVQFHTFDDMQEKSSRKRRAAPEGSGFSKADYQRADAYLHQIAETTGTPLYPAFDSSDLDTAVAGIVAELHNEYSVGYYPRTISEPGQVRRVEIKVNQAQLVVRARTGYALDKNGVVVSPPREVRTTATASSGSAFAPVAKGFEREKLPPGTRWICKGSTAPGDYAVVQEGFSALCPASTRATDPTNAWFIRKPAPVETICKGFIIWRGTEVAGAPIPSGYAVTAEVQSPVCAKSSDSKSGGNAWAVRIPGPRETVCKGFSIPRGFAVIGEKYSATCPKKLIYKNAWVIERVAPQSGN